jgi:DNA-binding protein YbaB
MDRVDREANSGLRARFDDVHAQYAKMREDVRDLQDDLAALEVTVRSPDGTVTVVIGPRGNLKSLSIDKGAYQQHPPERLATIILQACQRAESAAANAVQERMSRVLPEGSGLDRVLRRHDERMGYTDDKR